LEKKKKMPTPKAGSEYGKLIAKTKLVNFGDAGGFLSKGQATFVSKSVEGETANKANEERELQSRHLKTIN